MNKPTSQNTRVRNLSKKRERLADKPLKPAVRRRKSRYHLPAHVTEESQWASGEAPQAKSSRTFVAMLAVHLVAVGGLVAFHFFGNDPAEKVVSKAPEKKSAPATPAVAAIQPKASTPAPAIAPAPITPAIAPEPTALPPGYKEHVVSFEESWDSIAQGNSITVDDLQNANPGVDFNVGRLLRIPPAGNRIVATNDGHAKQGPSGKLDPMHFPDNSRGSSQIRYAPNPDTLTTQSIAKTSAAPLPSKPIAAQPTTKSRQAPEVAASSKRKDSGKALKASGVDTTARTSASKGVHTVSNGDTIYSIAKSRGISEKQLMRANGITDAGKLKKGQKLKLPADN